MYKLALVVVVIFLVSCDPPPARTCNLKQGDVVVVKIDQRKGVCVKTYYDCSCNIRVAGENATHNFERFELEILNQPQPNQQPNTLKELK